MGDAHWIEVHLLFPDGTASADLRAAYRLQILSAQNAPLLAAGIATQTNWVDTTPAEPGGQALMFQPLICA